MPTIELVAREWAWLQSPTEKTGDNTEKIIFDEDAQITRYRNLETAITYFRPQSPRELAIYTLVTAEQIHTKSTDYELDAPLNECGRAAFTTRDCLCEQIGHNEASLRAELLRIAKEPHDSPSVIQALSQNLSSAWQAHADLDRIIVSGRGSEADQAAMEMKAIEIEDIELAIASCRIQSPDDLAIVVTMLTNDAQQDDWPHQIQRDRRLKLWSDTIAEYQNRQGPCAPQDLAQRYSSRRRASPQTFAEAAE